MPEALGAKYPRGCNELKWQWLFPQKNRWKNELTKEEGRFHIDESQAFTSFIIDSVRHSHSYRESIIKKFEDDRIYLFFEKHLYDSSVDIRRNSLIILCDTLNIHHKNCKKVLEEYFFQVLRNDPLLMYDYISEFLWLYAYDSKMKNKLFSNIFNENDFITNICLFRILRIIFHALVK